MASTNKTSNLELSQFIATDTPTWLVDYNGDMGKIDAGVGRVEELAETARTQAVGVASSLQTTNQNVTTLSGQVANVQNQANNNTASVTGINQRLGNTDISGIGNGTITGAINAQNGKFIVPNYGSAVEITLPYTADNNGYIVVASMKLVSLKIGTMIVYTNGTESKTYASRGIIPIAKGDTLSLAEGEAHKLHFIPTK